MTVGGGISVPMLINSCLKSVRFWSLILTIFTQFMIILHERNKECQFTVFCVIQALLFLGVHKIQCHNTKKVILDTTLNLAGMVFSWRKYYCCNVKTFLIIDEAQKMYTPINRSEPLHGGLPGLAAYTMDKIYDKFMKHVSLSFEKKISYLNHNFCAVVERNHQKLNMHIHSLPAWSYHDRANPDVGNCYRVTKVTDRTVKSEDYQRIFNI
ncbi:hypothetical protein GLOIN_2v1486568 [Rhizophagus irregularis DAOM 181602=DAOM 197198]|uniref:Uncharacterized protein n=1 Tax=Rhizophagus irregularis (strain DAOM 181602 / DAOM 197198 / MUCL 43194) TaxID=747089 RepID=A0A2P4P6M6_RHIID|nr:hypothetical protein GLOIN_2v1486568 [Rhizophagus irregularis DAOM 181602=DAOM 197198]POG61031.1 hypothetical protein GLOIN_2v1486568 [Rhizophagus irregularis DAOM 181602=DAOM 197198]|eukprot:XP_025167897.1 hypothetical protein GLOIN_2v1486568 [Rhizophagus irregularis DAOM 181602=DAOM 197198]